MWAFLYFIQYYYKTGRKSVEIAPESARELKLEEKHEGTAEISIPLALEQINQGKESGMFTIMCIDMNLCIFV